MTPERDIESPERDAGSMPTGALRAPLPPRQLDRDLLECGAWSSRLVGEEPFKE
jgi:hypothetical protein